MHRVYLLITTAQIYIQRIEQEELKMNIRQKIAQFAQYQRTMRELNALDNRQLNDLGITKGDIKNIARGRAV